MANKKRPRDVDLISCPFHTRLIFLVHRKGLSCKQIAYEAGVSLNTVYHWTSGRRLPSSNEKYARLAECLGVTSEQLMTGRGL